MSGKNKSSANNEQLFSRDNYDDGFDLSGNDSLYNLDNFDDEHFDEDGAEHNKQSDAQSSDNRFDDYGDGFDSQTGEDKGARKDKTDYSDAYSASGMSEAKKSYNNADKQAKSKKNSKKTRKAAVLKSQLFLQLWL